MTECENVELQKAKPAMRGSTTETKGAHMNYALKLAAAVGLSLPLLFGASASAAPVTPASEYDPIMVLISQAVVGFDEASGGADRNH